MDKEDITEILQHTIGNLIKIDKAILDKETGVVDVLATPVKPVEYISINVTVKNDDKHSTSTDL